MRAEVWATFARDMREAVIVASSRTGLAKSFRGSFNMTRPEDLAAHCIQAVYAFWVALLLQELAPLHVWIRKRESVRAVFLEA